MGDRMNALIRGLRGTPDVIGSMASQAAWQPIAGLGGLAELVRSGGDSERAARRVEELQSNAYTPRTPEGQQMMGDLGRGIEWAGEKLGHPIQRAADKLSEVPVVGPALAASALGFTEVADPTKIVGKAAKAAKTATRATEAASQAAKSTLRSDIEQAVEQAAEHGRARKDMTVEQATAAGMAPTVDNPQRVAYPGIYKPSSQIAQEAKAMVGEESPLLKRLFGVTRADLQEMSRRKGNIEDPIRELIPGAAAKPKGSAAALSVMTPANADRILSGVTATRRIAPELAEGMQGWYVMDPMYHRMVELHGGDEDAALKAYNRLNAFGGVESPNMAVPNESRRAFAANYLNEQGRWPEWMQYGGMKAGERNVANLLRGLETVPGRVGHDRASKAQQRIIETGEHGMDSPKAPLYIAASGVPKGRFQTNVPVADAHFTRASGISDTRTNQDYEASITTPELQTLSPWFKKEVSDKLGIEQVPTQAEMWGVFSPQTGVKTKIGAPKLEIIADLIGNRAGKLGRSDLENVRDEILMGKQHLGAAAGLGTAGALASLLRGRQPEEEQ